MSSSPGYGSVDRSAMPQQNIGQNAGEQDALLPQKNKNGSMNIRKHMDSILTKSRADLVLLFSYIITGLLDSTATAVWGSFVSMQTGNTIYFGLGIVDPTNSTRWIKSGLSIVAFCFGSFCFSRFQMAFSMRKRWVMLTSVLLQLICIIASAIIVTISPSTKPGDSHDLHWHVLVAIGLVAFQSAGQAMLSRALQYGPLTSVVLTSIYLDLWSDPNLTAAFNQNVERNRRAAAPLLLLIGAMLGSVWSRSDIGMAGALWTAAALKVCTLFIWAFWKAEKPEDESS